MKPSNGWGPSAPPGSDLALGLGVFPLTATTLAVLLAVAALPTLVLQPDPQRRHDAAAVPVAAAGEVLAVARTGGGGWILNGVPLATSGLARLLRSRPQGVVAVRFLPSEALASADVAASLAWLRSHTALPVLLDPLTPAP